MGVRLYNQSAAIRMALASGFIKVMPCGKIIGKHGHGLRHSATKRYSNIGIPNPERGHGKYMIVPNHRIVAHVFHGEPPSPRHVVNHKNGIKTDNRPENLEWVTPAENSQHAASLGLMPHGSTNKSSVLTEDAVREIRATPRTYGSTKMLAKKFGVSRQRIWDVYRGHRWKHVGADSGVTLWA